MSTYLYVPGVIPSDSSRLALLWPTPYRPLAGWLAGWLAGLPAGPAPPRAPARPTVVTKRNQETLGRLGNLVEFGGIVLVHFFRLATDVELGLVVGLPAQVGALSGMRAVVANVLPHFLGHALCMIDLHARTTEL